MNTRANDSIPWWRLRTFWTIVAAVVVFGGGVAFETFGTKTQRDHMQLLAEALTFVALLFAWIQFLDARNQATHLRKIQESLSTRYISTFPAYLDNITTLVNEAREALIIFCDFPAYGAYSASSISLDYQQAVRRAAERRVKITIICYDSERRKRFNWHQFGPEFEQWDHTKETEPEKSRIEHLLRVHGNSVTLANLSTQGFIDLAEENDVRFLKSLGGLVKVSECSPIMPLYFWIRDNEEAFFAVPSLTHATDEYGFKTEDARLVASFSELQKRYCYEAPPIEVTGEHDTNSSKT